MLLIAMLVGCGDPSLDGGDAAGAASSVAEAEFVGRQACSECHPAESALYQGSHHDLAMQLPSEATILGDFEHMQLTHFGATATFSRRGESFLVRTEGADGGTAEFEVAYAFGVYPLQQYLVQRPAGRLQVLPYCWDSRPAAEGGQHWFHIYPDEAVPPGDVLHWTGLNQNWNFTCAECHSTRLEKNYDPGADAYATTFSELDVSCEACHGPASAHVEWARDSPDAPSPGVTSSGLRLRLRDDDEATWIVDPETGIAERSRPRQSRTQIETCARCHSRRSVIAEPYEHGRPLLDSHLPAVLEESLYYADGQILDEVYVYGSFRQSKMYGAGVTCSDCHDPHSLEVRGEGNAVCAGCHAPERFDTREHHFHELTSAGAACVECHMPQRTYMVVDDRRDHSLRVPRPDLSQTIGSPNPCTGCHDTETVVWATNAFERLWGGEAARSRHFGIALDAGRRRTPEALELLRQLANDPAMPNIARATALTLLGPYPASRKRDVLEASLEDGDPLLRTFATRASEGLPAQDLLRLLGPRLVDPVRAVRLEAARVLAALPRALLSSRQSGALELALGEYETAQRLNADRPHAQLNLGVLYTQRGDLAAAEAAYQTALRIAPSYLPAYANLADLYRQQGRDAQGEEILRRGLAKGADNAVEDNADLLHAMGLLLVRRGRLGEAIESLSAAVRYRPSEAHYGYVLAVALDSGGDLDGALETLAETHRHDPSHLPTLSALSTFSYKAGALDEALVYARRLVQLDPTNPQSRALLEELERPRPP